MTTPDLSNLQTGILPTTASPADQREALRRSYLAQMLSSGRQQQTPVGLGANLLAEALMLRRLRPTGEAPLTPPTTATAPAPGQ